MVERALEASASLLPLAAVVGDLAEGVPDVNKAGVILRFFEQGHRRAGERVELVHGVLELQPMAGGDDPCHGLSGEVAGSRRSVGRTLGDRGRLLRVGFRRPAARSTSRWTSSRTGRVSASARSSSDAAARPSPRASARRPPAARRSAARSASAESGCSSSHFVAGGLLEVVAEDLVQLDEIRSPLLEPVRRIARADRREPLSEGVVGRVTDEQMTEAIRLLARELRCVRANELLAYERHQSRRLRLAVRERLDGALVEHVALDRAALEDGALRRVELVETSREQRLDRRRHGDLG